MMSENCCGISNVCNHPIVVQISKSSHVYICERRSISSACYLITIMYKRTWHDKKGTNFTRFFPFFNKKNVEFDVCCVYNFKDIKKNILAQKRNCHQETAEEEKTFIGKRVNF